MSLFTLFYLLFTRSMWNFWKSRLRKWISIVAAMILLLNTIMPTVPVFAEPEQNPEGGNQEQVTDTWNGEWTNEAAPVEQQVPETPIFCTQDWAPENAEYINTDVEIEEAANCAWECKDWFEKNEDACVEKVEEQAGNEGEEEVELPQPQQPVQITMKKWAWAPMLLSTPSCDKVAYVDNVNSEEHCFDSLREAVVAATAGATITLVANDNVSFEENSTLEIDKAITIDWGENTKYTIHWNSNATTCDQWCGYHYILVKGSGAVTIKNLKIDWFADNSPRIGYNVHPIVVSSSYGWKIVLNNLEFTNFHRHAINIWGWEFEISYVTIEGKTYETHPFQQGIEIWENAHGTIDHVSISWIENKPEEDDGWWDAYAIVVANGNVKITNTTIEDSDNGIAIAWNWTVTLGEWNNFEADGELFDKNNEVSGTYVINWWTYSSDPSAYVAGNYIASFEQAEDDSWVYIVKEKPTTYEYDELPLPENWNIAFDPATTVNGESIASKLTTQYENISEDDITEFDDSDFENWQQIDQEDIQWEVEVSFAGINDAKFNKAMLVRIPVRQNTQRARVMVKHYGGTFWLAWLATKLVSCNNWIAEDSNSIYNWEYLPVENGYITIYACRASTFVSVSEWVASITKGGDTEYYLSLRDAVEWAVNGDTIDMLKDDHVSFVDSDDNRELTITKNIIIDGNGKTIYGLNDYYTADASGNYDHDIYIGWNEDITIKNLKISEFGGNSNVSLRIYPIWIGQWYNGTLTLDNITIDNFNRTAINANGWTVIVTDSEITGKTSVGNYFQEGIEVLNADVTVEDTEITGMWTDSEVRAACPIQLGNANFSGTNWKITINGGTYAWECAMIVAKWAIGTITVEDGDFDWDLLIEENSKGKIEISWWTFSEEIPMEYCAEGFTPTKEWWKYTVKAWYKVTFDPQNEEASFTWYIDSYDSIGSNQPVDPTKNNYTFGWWYTDPTDESTKYNFNSQVTSDLTLKAKWKNNVIFESNGWSTVEGQSVDHMWYATEPTAPTRDGYDFDGWYEDNTTFENLWTFNSSKVGTSPKTLYAKWNPKQDAVLYTVSHVKPDNSTKSIQYYGTAENKVPFVSLEDIGFEWYSKTTCKVGTTPVVADPSDNTLTNVEIKWDGSTVIKCDYAAADGANVYFYNDAPTATDPVLYEQWTAVHNGTVTMPTVNPIKTSAGHTWTFRWWTDWTEATNESNYYENCSSHLYNFSTPVTNTSDIKLYACYIDSVNTYTIKFLDENGALKDTVIVNYTVTPSYSGPDLTKDADTESTYTFAWWMPQLQPADSDATYTAVYNASPRKYTVTWSIDGTNEEEQIAYGTIPTHDAPTKDPSEFTDYTFGGWNDGTKTYGVNEALPSVTWEATYTATWIESANANCIAKIWDDCYVSLRAAIAAASEGATITMNADDHVSFNAGNLELEINKTITIDGKKSDTENYTIYGVNDYVYDSVHDHDIYISAWNVTIKNLNISEFAGSHYSNYRTYPIRTSQYYEGTLRLENVTIDKFNRTAINIGAGNVIIDGCTIEWDLTEEDGGWYFQGWIENHYGTVTVTNTTITWMWALDKNYESDEDNWSIAGPIQISGNGTITLWEGNNLNWEYGLISNKNAEGGKIIVSAWIINGKFDVETPNTIEISWGSFDDEILMEYCAEWFVPARSGGRYTVEDWYKVAFEDKDWNILQIDPVMLNHKATSIDAPVEPNLTFIGWYKVTETTVADTPFSFSNTQIKWDINLRAIYEATVTFDADGWTPVPDVQSVRYKELATAPTAPEKEGYKFDGWHKVTDGVMADEEFDFNTSIEENIALKAKWIKKIAVDENTIKESALQTAIAWERVNTNEGKYDFEWDEENKKITITDNELVTFKNGADTDWKWIGLIVDFGVPVTTAVSSTSTTYTIEDIDRTDVKYYSATDTETDFIIWISEAKNGNKIKFVNADPHATDDVIEIAFEFNQKVTFDTDGWACADEGCAEGEYAEQAVVMWGTANKPEHDPKKEGYKFDGWHKVTDGVMAEEEFNFTTAIEENTVLKAKWKDDKNNNGIADDGEIFTVKYVDWVDGEVIFEDESHGDLNLGAETPAFAWSTNRENYNFKWWDPTFQATVRAEDANVSSEIIYKAKWEKKWGNSWGGSWWWGGGWWGWGGSSYSCKNLPANATANNRTTPTSNIDYSYDTDTTKVCTFQCNTGYAWNETTKACEASQWTATNTVTNPDAINAPAGENTNWVNSVNSGLVQYDDEMTRAYEWAYSLGITTMPTIQQARLNNTITREQLAKMMVEFMSKVLEKKPIKTDVPKYIDVTVEGRGQEMYDYIVLAYQYQIMGIDAKWRPIQKFKPGGKVTRAEFATVLSRVLFGSTFNQSGPNYREGHIGALEDAGILTNTDPTITELRWWIILMLYRSQQPKTEAVAPATNTSEAKAEEKTEEKAEGETEETKEPSLGMPNPAAVYCEQQWWTISIVKDEEWNESWMCKLADGTEVEEWKYFRANNPETAEASTGDVVAEPEAETSDEAKSE